jgi:Domain of unknown function (DUF4232)
MVALPAPPPALVVAAPPRCHTRDLKGHFGSIQGAAGSRFGPLVLLNRSSHTCTVRGFVGGRLLNSAGHPLPTNVVRVSGTPVTTVTVHPGGKAVSTVRWGAIPSGGETCAKPRTLQVTPPDETATLDVAWPAGQPICEHGELDVRALRKPF